MIFPQHVQELLEKRYFLKDEAYKNYYGKDGTENWFDLCSRVAKIVSKNNPSMEAEYYNMLSRCEFLPNSPSLFGAGVPGLCLSACFVAPMQDSIEGWANTLKAAMKIQTAGGGIGFPLHKLRPSGFPVRGKIAKAAGPIEFMRCWNQISLSFRQAVRNGANMGQMHISHPNVEEFISCKDKDGELSAFNISVMIDDKFMDAVTKNTTYDLVWEDKVIKTVKARELWNKIIEHAWKTGEPGIIFFDAYQRSFPHTEEVYANPCLHEDTLVMTKEYGLVKIAVLPTLQTSTYDFEGENVSIDKVWKSGIKDCVKITLQNGREIICTPDHKFMTTDCKWEDSTTLLNKELKYVPISDWNGVIPKEYKSHDMTILGFIFGDGTYHKASNRVKYVYLGEKDFDVETYFKNSNASKFFDYEEKDYKGAVPIKRGYCDKLFTKPLPERQIPNFVKHLPKEEMMKFLKGLYSANGYITDDGKHNKRICFKMTNKNIISELQQLLAIIGIESKIQINKGKTAVFDNGEYLCKDSYSLNITTKESCVIFQDNIGFLQAYKNTKLFNMINTMKDGKKYPFNKVVSIEACGEHVVYDFSQQVNHCGNLSGLITHNCGEANIPQNGACNLGSINFMSCVYEDSNKMSYFDFSKFKTLICNSYVFLDDLIDINTYPTKEIEETVKKYRQIGLGVMGLADVFLRLGIRYGSDESLDLTRKIMSFKATQEHMMNQALGKKRGHYPAFKENRKEYPKRLTWLRNASTSCVAPTGSLSMIAGVSAGIEPVFSFEPITRVIDGVKKELFAPFKTGNPKIDVDANHVTPEEHIKILAICQEHTNMSISKTINLPNSATVEDVRKAYELAYTLGTKCVTVYRDGCRSNQTIQTSDTKKVYSGENLKIKKEEVKLDSILPVKRSGILTGKTFKDKIACGNLYTTINFDSHGDMLEVFVRPGKNGGCGSNVEAIARLLSMSLRSGVKIAEIVDQLKGIRCPACMAQKDKLKFTSCSDSIAKALEYATKHKEDFIIIREKVKEIEKSMEEQEKQLTPSFYFETHGVQNLEMLCPECGSKIALESGCRNCKTCGWSKCG